MVVTVSPGTVMPRLPAAHISARGLVDPGALDERAALLAARPAGHDHERHGHDGHEHDMHNGNPSHP